MAKCYFTGVELPLEETCVLNLSVAYRELRDLKQRYSSVERLIQQLSPRDDIEVYDASKKNTIIRKDRRLVSPAVALALSVLCPNEQLFMTWKEWRALRATFKVTMDSDEIKQSSVEQRVPASYTLLSPDMLTVEDKLEDHT